MIIALSLPRRGIAWSICVLLLGLAGSALAAERTDAIDDTVAQFFRPYQHDAAALAPDARHVALTEYGKDGSTAIVIVNLEDRQSRRYVVAGRQDPDRVQQLLWISPKRLVFTTRTRAIGSLEVGGEIEAVLLSRDMDDFRPEPILGPRTYNVMVTPDMSADAMSRGPAELEPRKEMTLTEALKQANVSGDVFGSDSKRDPGGALRPFLLGPKPGAPNTVLVEVRVDTDLYAYGRPQRTRITVPSDVVILDRTQTPPASREDLGAVDMRQGQYAAYDVEQPTPPLVVLELDTVKRKTKVVATEQNWRRTWHDHQGRLRLVLEQQGSRFRYLYRAVDTKKWVPLDSIAKTTAPLGFTVTPENLLAPRALPLGFDAEGRYLFVASNIDRDTSSVRVFNLESGQLEEFEIGHERFDFVEPTALTAGDVLRFDPHSKKLAGVRLTTTKRHTQWLDGDLKALQESLNKQLAPQRCDIREWNAERTRFLVETSSPGDPGGFLIVDHAAGKLIRCGERAPWLTAETRNPTHEFDFLTDDGRRIAGFLTIPRKPRLNPPPVLVYFHDGPWFSDPPLFNRGAQALAALGFVVLQVNHRGSSGLGRTHLTATKGGLDQVVLEDVKAMLARISASKLPINTRMVAALGNGIGGYLAVRMTQLAPETFRCAVAINAPGDLAAWRTSVGVTPTLLADQRRHVFGTEREALRAQSAVAAGPTKAPVLVVHAEQNAYVPADLGRELYRALKAGSPETAFLELREEGHSGWSEKTTARLFAELGRFFNATIYNYGVEVRTPKVVP